MADIFRGPIYAPQPKRKALAPDLVPNLLITTLAIVAAVAPFKQTDWQPTLKRRAVVQVEAPPNNLVLGIPPAVTRPFFQLDWQNPVRKKPDLDYMALVLAPVAPVATTPFAQLDWPNPVRARATPQDFACSGVTTRGIVPPPPFQQNEWVTPLKARWTQQQDIPPNTALYIPIPVRPFAQSDWQLHLPRKYAQQIDPIPNTVLRGIPQQMPFNQYDWPLAAKRARPPIQPESPPSRLMTVLYVAPVVLPFSLKDWPDPRRKPLIHTGFVEVSWIINAAGLPPVDPGAEDLRVTIPYLIGSTADAAIATIQALHLVASVTGSTGTVTAQDPAHMTLVNRGTTVNITLGGEINSVSRHRTRGQQPYNFKLS